MSFDTDGRTLYGAAVDDPTKEGGSLSFEADKNTLSEVAIEDSRRVGETLSFEADRRMLSDLTVDSSETEREMCNGLLTRLAVWLLYFMDVPFGIDGPLEIVLEVEVGVGVSVLSLNVSLEISLVLGKDTRSEPARNESLVPRMTTAALYAGDCVGSNL